MAKKILRDISFSSIQVILNQLFGLLIFYLTSRYLDKETFGELNWSIATASVVVTLLTFGLDIIVVRRIAAGENVKRIGGLHMLHTLMASILFIILLLFARHFFPNFFLNHALFTGICISLILTLLSSPFKQIANGKEAFGYFAIMTVTGNVMKGSLLGVLVLADILSTEIVVNVFIASTLIEWIIGMCLVYLKIGAVLIPYWNKKQYKLLLSESLPQLGTLIFDSALARIDWIILGIVAGSVITAEYSFAYKIFEISRLPVLILAPIILPKFIHYLANENSLSDERRDALNLLLRLETTVSVLIPIFFIVTWNPLMSWLTQDKYGTADSPIYLLLSLSIPLHYFNNFLWTMAVAQKQLKLTFYITTIVAVFNIILNFVLIPKYNATGAAIAFTSSTVLQLALYKVYVNQKKLNVSLFPLLKGLTLAVIAIIIAQTGFSNPLFASLAGISLYLLLAIIFKLLKKQDFHNLQSLVK